MFQPMFKEDCPFCERALKREFDGVQWIHDSPSIMNFVPLNPVTPGHRLFVPMMHIEHEQYASRLVGFTFKVAHEYATTQLDSFNLIISAGGPATQTIPHIHVHYVPRHPNDNLTLPWTGQTKKEDE